MHRSAHDIRSSRCHSRELADEEHGLEVRGRCGGVLHEACKMNHKLMVVVVEMVVAPSPRNDS